MGRWLVAIATSVAFLLSLHVGATADTTRTALALWGEPKLGDGFKAFPYADPAAPKGGRIVIGSPGTFDSLNPIILRGEQPRTLGLIYDSLMTASLDELGAAYPLIAERVDLSDDLSRAVFHIRAEARWHDGKPITARDFVYAWNMIQEHGAPFLKSFLGKTAAVEAVGERALAVSFSSRDEMKPIIDFATTVTPLPEQWWTGGEGRDISKTTLEQTLGSGPYRVAAIDSGRSITYERMPDYWAKDLPVNRGQYNFDQVRVDYYRDDDVMFEAFKSGNYDFHYENRSQRWATGYDFPAFRDGRVLRSVEANEMPLGAQGIRLNTRRPHLSDARVREALAWLFDFAWIRKNILYGQYDRVKSDFPNSDFGASGPPTEEERAILEPYKDRLDPRVLTDAFDPPPGGDPRAATRAALDLFKAAGWELKNGKLVDRDGKQFALEILEDQPSSVRTLQPYVTTLKKAGIDATIRIIDDNQMRVRQDEFDFDATVVFFFFFPPPGEELRSYFGSAGADEKGGANYSGVRDPVVDALIDKALAARDEKTIKATMRALDRVLLWNWYMIPEWYRAESWISYWDKFGRPKGWPRFDQPFHNSWFPAWWWAKTP